MAQIDQISRYRDTLINAAIVLIALIFSFNIYKDNAAKTESLKARISKEQQTNQELRKIRQLEGKVKAYKELLADKDESFVMSEINNIAKNNAVEILSIRPTIEIAKEDYKKRVFEVSINVPAYSNLVSFVNAVESDSSFYMVDGLEVSEQDPGVLRFNLRISSVVALIN